MTDESNKLVATGILENIAKATDPRFRLNTTKDYYTNREGAANTIRNINERAVLAKSLGYPGLFADNYPYKNYEEAVEQTRRNKLTDNFLNYAWFQKYSPDPEVDPNGNQLGLLNAYARNIYDKMMNGR